MLVEVELNPSGDAADTILDDWQHEWKLQQTDDGRVNLIYSDPLEVTIDLRNRCYDQKITVNLIFHDSP